MDASPAGFQYSAERSSARPANAPPMAAGRAPAGSFRPTPPVVPAPPANARLAAMEPSASEATAKPRATPEAERPCWRLRTPNQLMKFKFSHLPAARGRLEDIE